MITRSTVIALACSLTLLSGCQQEPAPPAEPQSQATPEPRPELTAPTPKPVILDMREEALHQLGQPEDNPLVKEAPVRLQQGVKSEKKVKLGGGVLTDPGADRLQDSLSGAEVEVKVKLD